MAAEQAIARREEARLVAGLATVGTEHLRLGGAIACYAGPGSWANTIAGLGLDGPVSEADLDAIDAFFAGRGVDVRAEVSPYADAGLLGQLAARGFRPEKFENLLAREIAPEEPLEIAPPPGISVRRAGPGDHDVFVEVAASGFQPAGQPMSDVERQVGLQMIRSPLVFGVMAWDGPTAVAAGYAEVRDGVAALFGASTLPDWRGRGIQGALIRARLAEARSRGATVATIASLPGEPTERNVARVGFRVVCTRLVLVRSAA